MKRLQTGTMKLPVTRYCRSIALVLLLLLGWPTLHAQVFLDDAHRFELFGDVRLRFEADWDSRHENGTRRDDRERLRLRTRLGLEIHPADRWGLVVRGRTGSQDSQQSPFLTFHDFEGGPRDHVSAVLDQYYLKGAVGGASGWLGRNEFPFFTANESEMLWDKDATILGAYLDYKLPIELVESHLRGGFFGLPDGAVDLRGRMAAVQAVLKKELGQGWVLEGAVGCFNLDGNAGVKHLLDGNGRRDYQIGATSLKLSHTFRKGADQGVPLKASWGGDVFHNFQHYSVADPDLVSATYRHDKTGAVFTTALGQRTEANKRGEWEIRYTIGYIEKLAVNAAYAQDDWVRWGKGPQTDSSNLRGHEMGLRYWLAKNFDVHARFYAVESITTPQDGLRFRLDLNYKF